MLTLNFLFIITNLLINVILDATRIGKNRGKGHDDNLNNEINDEKMSYSFNSLRIIEQPSIEQGEYLIDHNRFEEINQALIDFPKVINQIIGIFDYYNESLYEFYKKVMDNLEIFGDKRKVFPSFYSRDFANQLVKVVLERKDDFGFLHPFWFDLIRLLFKWMVYMKQRNINDNAFKEAIKSIKSITFIIFKATEMNFPLDFDLKIISKENFLVLKGLVDCEILENPAISYSFASVVEHFYGNDNDGRGRERGRKFPSLKELQSVHFNDRFDNNPILKLMILLYDPQGKIRENFSFLEHPRFPPISSKSIIPINSKYLDELRANGPDQIDNIIIKFASSSMLKILIETNYQFHVYLFDLLSLLRKLRESGLLKVRLLTEILEIQFYERDIMVYKWKKTIFNSFIEILFENQKISEEERSDFIL